MSLKNQLSKCHEAYHNGDYRKLNDLCELILKEHPENPNAIGYKGIALCFLDRNDEAVKILERGVKLYPKNYYLKNNLAMAYYDIGEYEKSLECCEAGLKIRDFDWLLENKIKALIRLDRIGEAMDCYENSKYSPIIDIVELLIEGEKYGEALEHAFDEDAYDGYVKAVDKIKQSVNENGLEIPEEIRDYYKDWIYKILYRNNTEICPECGGELIPIVWGYPSDELLRKAARGEVFLGGCDLPIYLSNYHCKSCGWDFNLGYEGLHIECDDGKLLYYVEYKVRELTSKLKSGSMVYIRSIDSLKNDLKGFDDEEFDAFISHMLDLGYIRQPREGYVRIVGYDDLKCMKEYLDEGKFAAPRWLAFPQFSAWTIGWRMGAGETYAMNEPVRSDEFKKLFPMPKYWNFRFSESPYKPHPLIGYFWSEDGKPKYPKASEGLEVNAFITLDDEKIFYSDTFAFRSIAHAVSLSKCLHFEKCGRKDDLDVVEFTLDEEKNWDIYKYSVLLNASYFKIMQDGELKQWLLETGDEPLVYVSDDEENLFGRALMELRDEIRRICENEDRIDWGYTEYLKHKPWLD